METPIRGELMRVTVFGAAGTIGREIVTDLLFRGHEVVAYLPRLKQVPDNWGEEVEVVVGELTDAAAVDIAVAAGEAVINALDPRLAPPGAGASWVRGTGNIVDSMQHHGIDRYIGHGTPAVGLCPGEQPTARVRMSRFMAQCLRPHAYRQMKAMFEVVTGSGLDWTIVRFIRMRKGTKAHGLKHVGLFGQEVIGCSATKPTSRASPRPRWWTRATSVPPPLSATEAASSSSALADQGSWCTPRLGNVVAADQNHS